MAQIHLIVTLAIIMLGIIAKSSPVQAQASIYMIRSLSSIFFFLNKVLLYIMIMTTSPNESFVRAIQIPSNIRLFYDLKAFTFEPHVYLTKNIVRLVH